MSQHEPRPVRSFQGVDATWAWAFVRRLEERGASSSEVNRAVGDLHDAHARSAMARERGLHAAFGDPVVLADQWTLGQRGDSDEEFLNMSGFALGREIGMPVYVAAIVWIAVMVVACFASIMAGIMYADGGSGVHMTSGFLLGVLAPLAVVLGCTLLPMRLLLNHLIALMFVLTVVLVVLIVVAVMWQVPLVWIPRAFLVGAAVVLTVVSVVGLRVEAGRAERKGDEPIAKHMREISWLAVLLGPVAGALSYFG